MISFTRTQLTGLGFLLLATGIAITEHQSITPVSVSNSTELIVAQNDTKNPGDLTELAEQIATPTDGLTEAEEKQHVIQISSGDTMNSMLTKLGITREEAAQAVEALKRVYDTRDLKVGQELNVRYNKDSSQQKVSLLSLSFKAAHNKEIALEANGDVFTAKMYEIALRKVQKCVEGNIGSSFYSAALKRGVPPTIVREAINALSYDIDWQRDPTREAPFKIVYNAYEDTNGNVVRAENLQYVEFAPAGRNSSKSSVRRVYHFQPVKGTAGYYNSNGESVVKTLLATPMDPSKMRVTSKFGRRVHPCLGYSKQHKGVDFGAPTGTPVRAAGDGVVVKSTYWGHYGNIIQIQHNKEYTTAYAHLSRMNVKVGQRVKQNQIIGKVGATGRTTGAHLHYEVLRNGVHINPQSIKLLPTVKLNPKDLAAFHLARQKIEKELAEMTPVSSQVAAATPTTRTS